jgi:manganese/zinc/iron transport system permease protein
VDIIGFLSSLFTDYTLRTVALGTATLGIISGALGSYAVLRKQSLLGDAISHAALPGIALAFMLTHSKAPLVLVLGAAVAGWLATFFITNIVRYTRVKEDSSLGLVLSVFFGFGLVLLTFIQKQPDASQAGLDKFLFGQAAALVESDVLQMAALGAIAVAAMVLLWKEFKLLSFDPDFGAILGFRMRLLDLLVTTLLVIAIVLGLQTVGVVLMSAMIIAPAVAARQWTDRLGLMVGLAALFGALAGVSGALISGTAQQLPTGPTVVLCISAVALLSITFAPNRGIVPNLVRRKRNRRRLVLDAILADLYVLSSQHTSLEHGHAAAVLEAMTAGRVGVQASLEALRERGLVREVAPGEWALTPAGLAEAKRITLTSGEGVEE